MVRTGLRRRSTISSQSWVSWSAGETTGAPYAAHAHSSRTVGILCLRADGQTQRMHVLARSLPHGGTPKGTADDMRQACLTPAGQFAARLKELMALVLLSVEAAIADDAAAGAEHQRTSYLPGSVDAAR